MARLIRAGLVLALLGSFVAGNALAQEPAQKTLAAYIGPDDGMIVKRVRDNAVLFAENSEQPFIPASIIKIATSLMALHVLGENFRFTTECYQRTDGSLIIKGYGDPSFVSEEIASMALALSRIVRQAPRIIVDDSYFQSPLDIPGRSHNSPEPYDALNGALCANYNTLAFTRKNGHYVSAEPQTPLVPFALEKIRSLPQSNGRVMFLQGQHESALYAGELLSYFLSVDGCRVGGPVESGRVDAESDRLVYRHVSGKTLREIVSGLLRYSSNFTANQLLLVCGAQEYGPPATLSKGLRVAQSYFRDRLHTQKIQLAEGSGLSRDNRVSPETMCIVLDSFAPYRELLKQEGEEYYKTGTLNGVSTRAGYITGDNGDLFQFVIMLNTPGKSAERLMPSVKQLMRQADGNSGHTKRP